MVLADRGVAHLLRVNDGTASGTTGGGTERTGVVNDDDVRLRTGPSMEAGIIRELDGGPWSRWSARRSPAVVTRGGRFAPR
jgi:hypothetical protein